MKDLNGMAGAGNGVSGLERDFGALHESDEGKRMMRRGEVAEPSEGLSHTRFEGLALTLRHLDEGRHRLGLDLDLTLEGSEPEDSISAAEDEELDAGETELEDETSAADEDEESAASELSAKPEGERAEAEDDESIEDSAEAAAEDSLGEEDEDDEELEASAEFEDEFEASAEDEDDEELEASAEDEDDEELEAGAEDDDELEAGAEDEDEDEDEDELEASAEDEDIGAAGEEADDDEALHDTEREERAGMRSARGSNGRAESVHIEQEKGKLAASGLRGEAEPRPRPAKKSQADRVITIAKKQEGFREGKNNYTKFAAELIKAKIAQPWWQNQPWCETFQAWAFVEAGYRKLAPMTPGCATAVAWFRKRKRVNQYPAIGAQVFFGPGGKDHVGLVYKYDPTHIWTIEGNTNDNGSSEGIGVFLKKRSRKSASGYGYPEYGDGIVTADPRKKGHKGFTFKKAASSGVRDSASEPEREEKSLPWVSVKQVQWAATHSVSAERAAKAGVANPRDDVKLVQQALEKVMGTSPKDPAGIYGEDTDRLFNRFRRDKLKFAGSLASAKPGPKALAALGRRSDLFRVRQGSMAELDEKSGPTTPARLSPRDVTFKRFTTPSSPERISTWIRQACRKAGMTPSGGVGEGLQDHYLA